MRGRICALGNGQGVLLPLEAFEKLKLAVESEVDVVDGQNGSIVIMPVTTALVASAELPAGVRCRVCL